MDVYLSSVQKSLKNLTSFSNIHIVVGNESCDLDSVVCAIAYAFYLSQASEDETTLTIPLLNIPQSQLRIRTEIVYFLNSVKIPIDDLVFRDNPDLDLEKLAKASRLKLTLVDHHVLTGQLANYESCVVNIIDHRTRERPDEPGVRVKLDLVGSCSTLVAEELLDDPDFVVDAVVAELLYGTILVDTINRLPDAGKITPRDDAVLKRLTNIIPSVNGDKLYARIQTAKTDMSGLSNMDILEKDMKIVSGTDMVIAMSSVTMEMKELLERENFAEDLAAFCASKSADVVVIMTMWTNSEGGPSREIAVFSTNRIYRDQISDVLKKADDPDLALWPLEPQFENLAVCSQGNIKASRKKVIPILKTFVAKK